MYAKDVARGFLRQFVNRTPQSSDIEITLVESNHQQVCLLRAKEIDDRFDLVAIDYVALDFDEILAPKGHGFLPQQLTESDAVFLQHLL
jgi:hypothetical protein